MTIKTRIINYNRFAKEYVPFMPSVASEGWQLPVFPGLMLPLFATTAYILSLKTNNPIKIQTLIALIGSVGVFSIANNMIKHVGKDGVGVQPQNIDIFITWIPLVVGRYFNWELYNRKAITDPFKPAIKYAFNFIIPEKYKHLIETFSDIAISDVLRHITNMTINQIIYANNCAINGGSAQQVSDNICNGIKVNQIQVAPGITHKTTLWQLAAGIVAFTALAPLKYAVKTRLGCTDQSVVIGPMTNAGFRAIVSIIINSRDIYQTYVDVVGVFQRAQQNAQAQEHITP